MNYIALAGMILSALAIDRGVKRMQEMPYDVLSGWLVLVSGVAGLIGFVASAYFF